MGIYCDTAEIRLKLDKVQVTKQAPTLTFVMAAHLGLLLSLPPILHSPSQKTEDRMDAVPGLSPFSGFRNDPCSHCEKCSFHPLTLPQKLNLQSSSSTVRQSYFKKKLKNTLKVSS